jgi:hypothetical protein
MRTSRERIDVDEESSTSRANRTRQGKSLPFKSLKELPGSEEARSAVRIHAPASGNGQWEKNCLAMKFIQQSGWGV